MFNHIKQQLKSSKRFRKLLILVPLIILFMFCGVTLVNQSADISRMQQQKNELSVELAAKKESNDRLQEIVNSDNKDDYIEQKAREKGYVKSNEIVFYDISGTE